MLCPERLAVAQFHLILQLQALTLPEKREGETERWKGSKRKRGHGAGEIKNVFSYIVEVFVICTKAVLENSAG